MPMSEFDNAPVFGRRVEGCPYVVRPSAYALVRNATGELAVVRTVLGYFLPGGGIEAGESPEQTVVREAREECGLVLRAGAPVTQAIEIAHSPSENTCFEKRCTFVSALLIGLTTAEESDHELMWMALDGAMHALTHGSHQFAVQRLSQSEPR